MLRRFRRPPVLTVESDSNNLVAEDPWPIGENFLHDAVKQFKFDLIVFLEECKRFSDAIVSGTGIANKVLEFLEGPFQTMYREVSDASCRGFHRFVKCYELDKSFAELSNFSKSLPPEFGTMKITQFCRRSSSISLDPRMRRFRSQYEAPLCNFLRSLIVIRREIGIAKEELNRIPESSSSVSQENSTRVDEIIEVSSGTSERSNADHSLSSGLDLDFDIRNGTLEANIKYTVESSLRIPHFDDAQKSCRAILICSEPGAGLSCALKSLERHYKEQRTLVDGSTLFRDGISVDYIGFEATEPDFLKVISNIISENESDKISRSTVFAESLEEGLEQFRGWLQKKQRIIIFDSVHPKYFRELIDFSRKIESNRVVLTCLRRYVDTEQAQSFLPNNIVNWHRGAEVMLRSAKKRTRKILQRLLGTAALAMDNLLRIEDFCEGSLVVSNVVGHGIREMARNEMSASPMRDYVQAIRNPTGASQINSAVLKNLYLLRNLHIAADPGNKILKAFGSFSVFDPEVWVPFEVIRHLWEIEEDISVKLAQSMHNFGLIEFKSDSSRKLRIKYAIWTQTTIAFEENGQCEGYLHRKICHKFFRSAENFLQVEHDQYLYDFIIFHLLKGGRFNDVENMLVDVRWTWSRLRSGGLLGLVKDFKRFSSTIMDNSKRRNFQDLISAIRYAWREVGPNKEDFSFQINAMFFNRKNVAPFRSYINSISEHMETQWLQPLGQYVAYNQKFDLLKVSLNEVSDIEGKSIVRLSNLGRLAIAIGKSIVIINEENMTVSGSWPAHKDHILSMSASGKYLASCSMDKTVKVWNTQTLMTDDSHHSEPFATLKHEGAVTSVAVISPREGISKKLFIVSGTGDEDCKLRIWDVRDAAQRSCIFEENHGVYIRCISVSGSGELMVSGDERGLIRRWELEYSEDGQVRIKGPVTFKAHEMQVNCLSISNEYIFSGSEDGTINVWSRAKEEKARKLEAHSKRVTCLALFHSVDGAPTYVVSGSDDKTLQVWKMGEYGGAVGLPIKSHNFQVRGIHISTDRNEIVTVSKNKYLCTWVLDTDQVILKQSPVKCMAAFDRFDDQKVIACGCQDKCIRQWGLTSCKHLSIIADKDIGTEVKCVGMNKDFIAAGCGEGYLFIWNSENSNRAMHKGDWSEVDVGLCMNVYVIGLASDENSSDCIILHCAKGIVYLKKPRDNVEWKKVAVTLATNAIETNANRQISSKEEISLLAKCIKGNGSCGQWAEELVVGDRAIYMKSSKVVLASLPSSVSQNCWHIDNSRVVLGMQNGTVLFADLVESLPP